MKITRALDELGDLLGKVEIDTLQITSNCPRRCEHCSQNPGTRLLKISVEQFEANVDEIIKIKEKGNDLLTNYVLTSADSEPFLHPDLARLVELFHDKTGKRFYLLTSGWYDYPTFQQNADWIASHPEYVERVALTVSHLPTNPSSIYDCARLQSNVIKTFKEMSEDKFLISPQYNEEVDKYHIHSRKHVEDLLNNILREAGLTKEQFQGRIHYRPIIGLGRAVEKLGVQKSEVYRIEAEIPAPVISERESKRPYSGLIDMVGDLLVLEAPRAILNRELKEYQSASIPTLSQSSI
ncbi:MAG: radical SAM protein [Candidatus Woesearchaeota archaeon]